MTVCSEARRMQNMSAAQIQAWMQTEAYRAYKRMRDQERYSGYTDNVAERAAAVAKGSATPQQCQKVKAYLARSKGQAAGRETVGSGPTAVSKQTAALRNWGFDPTGRFS